MIKGLVYDNSSQHRSNLRSLVSAALADLGIVNLGLTRARSPQELQGILRQAPPGLVDLVLCRVGEQGEEDFAALRRIREEEPGLDIIILAPDEGYAEEAAQIDACGYCLEGEGPEGLKQALATAAIQALERHDGTMGLRSAEGVWNLILDQIVFVESSKKGAVLHLATGKTLLVRSTLQNLADKLESKGTFMKVGGSFVVNIDNVRSVGEGAIIFSDGESIIVPVRMRKQVRERVDAHWKRQGAQDPQGPPDSLGVQDPQGPPQEAGLDVQEAVGD